MPAHLLQLANMHREGPGSLDVVFGVDGDFEGAPRFTGPLVSRNPRSNADRYEPLRIDGSYDWDRLAGGGFALDLRIPSVATRMAGLCAEIIWPNQIIPGAQASVYQHGDWIHLAVPHGGLEATWRTIGGFCGGWCANRDVRDMMALDPADGETFTPASFLASLCLALAPKIAALPASARSR